MQKQETDYDTLNWKAYYKGRDCATRGGVKTENFYARGSDLWQMWRDGFNEAKLEDPNEYQTTAQ